MKFVVKNNKIYVRRWFKWYYISDMVAFRINFKAADEATKYGNK